MEKMRKKQLRAEELKSECQKKWVTKKVSEE